MAASRARVLRVSRAFSDERDPMPAQNARRRMLHHGQAALRSQKRVAAKTRILDKPIPRRHTCDAVAEQPA